MLSFASDERAACFWAFYYEENVSREQESFFDACGDFLKRKSHHQEREREEKEKRQKSKAIPSNPRFDGTREKCVGWHASSRKKNGCFYF